MTPTSSGPLRPLARSPLPVWLFAVALATVAPAQAVTFVARSGSNLGMCGHLGTGPVVNHHVTTVAATNDPIAVSDPGGPPPAPPSAATADMVVNAGANGIAIAVAGTATRGGPGGFGIAALADGRDGWDFTVAAAVRFSLAVSLSAASTEATTPLQAFNFFLLGGGAALIPDPGTVWPPAVSSLTTPGSVAVTEGGTLLPGLYHVDLFGRAEGNTAPYTGSYDNSLTLTFLPAATIAARQAIGNPPSGSGAGLRGRDSVPG